VEWLENLIFLAQLFGPTVKTKLHYFGQDWISGGGLAYGAGGDWKETEIIKCELLDNSFNVKIGSGRICSETRQSIRIPMIS
jgi:hypothetical protein